MKKILLVSCVILSITLTSCATPYQATGFSGGYSQTKLGPNIYRVDFHGNGFTSTERASDFLMLRCAQLTLDAHYQFFAFLSDKNEGGDSSTVGYSTTTYSNGYANTFYVPPVSVYKPGEAVMIEMFHTPPKNVPYALNAEDVFSSITKKYGLNIAP